ncbi:MAG TPA: DUF6455 family protein [Acetobacteraceae bacterium]|jgi:hypothetical protein
MPRSTKSLDRPGLLAWARNWMKQHARPADNLAGFSRAEIGQMAEDLGVTTADVVALANHAPDNTALTEAMMRSHGLKPAEVRDSMPTLLRDIQRVCTRCRNSKRCLRELDAGTAAGHAHEFCPNASTFDDIADYSMGR